MWLEADFSFSWAGLFSSQPFPEVVQIPVPNSGLLPRSLLLSSPWILTLVLQPNESVVNSNFSAFLSLLLGLAMTSRGNEIPNAQFSHHGFLSLPDLAPHCLTVSLTHWCPQQVFLKKLSRFSSILSKWIGSKALACWKENSTVPNCIHEKLEAT